MPLLGDPLVRDLFETQLERARRWYGLFVTGYVVMPEHVHVLMSEPERSQLSVVLQMLKQNVSQALGRGRRFWLPRYYDFNVWSGRKIGEKLDYMHENPVKRGLVVRSQDWRWSSCRHYLTGLEGVVEIESHWTARKREQRGEFPTLVKR